MFDFFLSRVRGILSSDKTTKAPVKIPTVKPDSDDNNRVVFTPSTKPVHKNIKKPSQPSTPAVDPSITNQIINKLKSDLQSKEAEIFKRLQSLDEKERYLIQKEKTLDTRENEVKAKLESLDDLYRKQLEKLEAISGLDVNKAKQLIISSTEKKMSNWLAQKIQEARDSLKQQEDDIAKEVLTDALRHGVTEYVAEYTVSVISLPDETVKGKIIGREGRNIRAFEKATGVEIELDETNDIRISSFDSTRREIARIALEKLIKDGRIQPVKIEQVVAQTKQEMDRILLSEGKRVCQEVGVYNLPSDLVSAIGKYKYRFSYGQNLAKHTIEATKIAVALAHELRADVNTVRLGCLLHDIGKVITDQEGTHVELGVDLLRQHKISEKVIDCVAQHHQDQEFTSTESVLVYLGDAASGARPGARYEVHEEYLKRMKNIEEVAKGFPGVVSVAAYQAGREVMVIVEPNQVSDSDATVLSQNIADKLDEEAKWAGQIKVTVIRETRTSAVIVGSKINKNAVN